MAALIPDIEINLPSKCVKWTVTEKEKERETSPWEFGRCNCYSKQQCQKEVSSNWVSGLLFLPEGREEHWSFWISLNQSHLLTTQNYPAHCIFSGPLSTESHLRNNSLSSCTADNSFFPSAGKWKCLEEEYDITKYMMKEKGFESFFQYPRTGSLGIWGIYMAKVLVYSDHKAQVTTLEGYCFASLVFRCSWRLVYKMACLLVTFFVLSLWFNFLINP